jgi:hypothetical protein
MDEPITFAKYTVRDASLIGPAAGEGLCPLGMLSKGRIEIVGAVESSGDPVVLRVWDTGVLDNFRAGLHVELGGVDGHLGITSITFRQRH